MKSCCESKSSELANLRLAQGKVLKTVLWINLAMFILEFSFGIISSSAALLADSLDMLGDAFVYGFSLYVLHKSPVMRARAAFLKGFIMLATGVGVGIEVSRRAMLGDVPQPEIMGSVATLALLANVYCAYLLFKHKSDDANLRSTWLCSRNDVISNIGVIAASGLVYVLQSKWPDIAVGAVISLIFLWSSFDVFRESLAEMRLAKQEAPRN